jgi:hypothetical protein
MVYKETQWNMLLTYSIAFRYLELLTITQS